MYKRPLCFAKDPCVSQGKQITILTNGMRNLIIWKYQEMPRDVPCISFDIISPGSYRLQKHRFVFNSQVLQSTSEEREVNLECYQESQHQNQTPKD